MPASAPAPRASAAAAAARQEPPAAPALITSIDGVAAIVNDDVITLSELRARMGEIERSGEGLDPARLERERQKVLRTMVRERLYDQAARSRGIDEKRVSLILEAEMEDLQKRAGGRQQLEANLRAQGKSYAELEREKRSEVKAYLLQNAEVGIEQRPEVEVTFTPGEIRAYYREHPEEFQVPPSVRGRQIVLSFSRGGGRDAVMEKIRSLREKILAGADFAALAREHSELAAAEGGELGWVRRGMSDTDPRIEHALFSHEPGTVTEPIELDGAVAMVRVEEKRPAMKEGFTGPVQKRISDKLIRQRRDQILIELDHRLRLEAYIWPRDLFPRW